MKKTTITLIMILCLAMILPVFAEEELTNENMFGKNMEFSVYDGYTGDIVVNGLFIKQDDEEYILTVLYSNGELVKLKYKDDMKVKTSFFSRDDDETLKISWVYKFDQITSNDNYVQIHVDKEQFKKYISFGIFLYDVEDPGSDANLTVNFRTNDYNYDDIPHVDNMYAGYKPSTDELKTTMNSEPASWAKKNIEELQLEGILREDAFTSFSEGITRARFVYLMVNLYEELTESQIAIDSSISFDDSDDSFVLKAASIGITTGIGDNKFGPDIILNREQMTTFLIKTLNLANVELTVANADSTFTDDGDISDWAKSFIYTAKTNGIMGGTGNNNFSPKGEATNEQALYITHSLLSKHGSLEWLEAFDGARLYLKKDGELYNLSLMGDIIISEEDANAKLYVNSIEDTKKVVNALLLDKKHIAYTSSTNPNVKGNLKEYDYKKMVVSAENLYAGVDKNGEKTIINVDNGKFKAEVSQNLDGLNHTIKNFDKVKFYDLVGNRAETHVLPLDKIAEALEVEYKVSYDTIWDIYVIEVIEE